MKQTDRQQLGAAKVISAGGGERLPQPELGNRDRGHRGKLPQSEHWATATEGATKSCRSRSWATVTVGAEVSCHAKRARRA